MWGGIYFSKIVFHLPSLEKTEASFRDSACVQHSALIIPISPLTHSKYTIKHINWLTYVYKEIPPEETAELLGQQQQLNTLGPMGRRITTLSSLDLLH